VHVCENEEGKEGRKKERNGEKRKSLLSSAKENKKISEGNKASREWKRAKEKIGETF